MKDTVIVNHTIEEIRTTVATWKNQGFSIGLVPTMGYLHGGHGSLIKRAAEENQKVIVSIFVNPMQFSPGEDLDIYPRDPDRDRRVCLDHGAHLIFQPKSQELYPPGFCSFVDLSGPADGLCGKSRNSMFRGVATVVLKLLLITGAQRAYFGQKDAQQLAVVKRMTEDLNVPAQIVGCPIIREDDGLAMSSRNVYLSPEERRAALCLSLGLREGLRFISEGEDSCDRIIQAVEQIISSEPLAKIDYIKIVDPKTMKPVKRVRPGILCAVAAHIGKTRLIDNFLWNGHGNQGDIYSSSSVSM